jgi:pSer/pThr/pTyr-binding forkhead associated (FHA) protein
MPGSDMAHQATGLPQLVVRRGQQEIDLGLGDCFIGRDPECAVCLDDPMVSRKHARITVENGTATITDMASANGVFVNGQRVLSATTLRPGDLILIGKEEIEIAAIGEPPVPSSRKGLHALTRDTLRMNPLAGQADAPQNADATTRVDTFALISKVVDRVLAEGRGQDAERMLSPQRDVLLRDAVRRGSLPAEATSRATEYAVKLARATRDGRWVDYVIQLHGAVLRPLPAGITAELMNAAKGCGDFNRAAVRAYISRLLSSAERLSTEERLDLQTLGGIAGAPSTR